MAKEIEVKILDIDVLKMRRTLKKIGAKQILKPTLFREIYWKSKERKPKFSVLRLRDEGKKSFLTLKVNRPSKAFKILDEFEVEVSNFQTTQKILTLAGFTELQVREKYREAYRLSEVRVEIDRYPRVPAYLEVEGKSEAAIRRFLKKVNIPFSETSAKTAAGVIKATGLNPKRLVFKKR